jgi:hypothetical protein
MILFRTMAHSLIFLKTQQTTANIQNNKEKPLNSSGKSNVYPLH